MLALAIVIALLGIANTLSLAVYERRTELGLLRAVGETRRQVRSMLRLESVILATFGTALGLVLGGVLGCVLFTTVSDGGAFTVPPVPIVVIAVLGSAAGVLAALRPARRAAKPPHPRVHRHHLTPTLRLRFGAFGGALADTGDAPKRGGGAVRASVGRTS